MSYEQCIGKPDTVLRPGKGETSVCGIKNGNEKVNINIILQASLF